MGGGQKMAIPMVKRRKKNHKRVFIYNNVLCLLVLSGLENSNCCIYFEAELPQLAK
jgi:hypothetical protein